MPHGWTHIELDVYARRNLVLAEAYTQALPKGPARDFCVLPLALAQATLDTMTNGLPKLSRSQVMAVVNQVTGLSF
jgi:farnesyl-diphosphate farnesyltransferase